ncbi:hypothetical protein IWQ62_003013 [Dispira parvispora]|uniref:Centromere protein K n=1 Tax=Dispira parvispora TaxID=1520584 RepID=A0A9W8ANS2_9FUNG|nr:hypothetical protein IWQ62_003013 [Dispira parvispora]
MDLSIKRQEILLAEEKRLQIEINRLKELNDRGLPPHSDIPDLSTAVLKLQEEIHDLNETIANVQGHVQQLRTDIAQDRTLWQETESLESALQSALATHKSPTGDGLMETLLQEKKDRLKHTRQQSTQIMGELLRFLQAHYPPVTLEEHPTRAKRSRSMTADSAVTTPPVTSFSLADLLEDLMNLSVSSPGNPYYSLQTGQYWEPYVDLLLKAGVIIHHPQDVSRIKLVEFHH